MDNNYEDILMSKTVWYYYFDGMTQQEISDFLGIPRMRVVKLLNRARSTGAIQFKIKDDSANRMQLEKTLAEVYALKDTFIVSTPPNSINTNENIARAAAMYINNRLKEDAFINLGYGDTPSRVLNNLATMVEKPISIVSLTGGVNYYLPNNMSSIFNAKLYLIPSPLLVSSKDVVDAIRNENSVKDILRMAHLSSLSVVGIGSVNENATTLKSGILSNNDLLCLKMKGAIADILCHFIDKDGNSVESAIEPCLISMPLKDLHSLQNVVGVAAGKDKIAAIRAVLRGGYIDILITDEVTAQGLISSADSTKETPL
jgi:lsr operon transcriptional repressor